MIVVDEAAWKEHERIQETGWWHRHKRAFLLHQAEASPYSRVLEIGAGGSSLSEDLQSPCQKTTTDLSARHVGPGGVVARLPELSFKPDTFDLIFLSDVLEHLDDPIEALKTIRRILKPGGRCLITVPAWPGLWSEHDIFYGHKKRYTPEMLRAEIQTSGLSIHRRGWIFFGPLCAAFARRALRAALGSSIARPPQSNFPDLPPFVNAACLSYLRVFEQPLAFRMLLPLGLTHAAVVVKPGNLAQDPIGPISD